MSEIGSICLPQEDILSSDQSVNFPPLNENLKTDSQVKAKKTRAIRRKFSLSDKRKIIDVFDACEGTLERGEFLRKEGLYYASISKWKKQLSEKKSSRENAKWHQRDFINQQLLRENERLKKKLSQAEAIIEIQKKVSKLLSDHVIDQETNEGKS